MKERRGRQFLVEPPASATGDIAFNLIIFFLVCASVQPDSGRSQTIPRSEKDKQQQQQLDNIEVQLTRTAAMINGNVVSDKAFYPVLKKLLDNKIREEDKVVIVKSKTDTPYHHWIKITEFIEQAGGIITIQTEEQQIIYQ
jgi:biopolymer transport protein ExbD